MNKLNFSLIISFILLLAVGCSSNKPESVAKSFLTAFNENDYEEARKYSTVETSKLIDLMENLAKLSDEHMQSEGFEIIDSRIDGDKAYVTYQELNSEGTTELILKKVDGKWLVHITKEDIATKGLLGSPEDEEGFWDEEPEGEKSEATSSGGVE